MYPKHSALGKTGYVIPFFGIALAAKFNEVKVNLLPTSLLAFPKRHKASFYKKSFIQTINAQPTAPRYRRLPCPSSHHHIISSSHHLITSSHHHIITSSHHHIITSSHHHIITSSHHIITSAN